MPERHATNDDLADALYYLESGELPLPMPETPDPYDAIADMMVLMDEGAIQPPADPYEALIDATMALEPELAGDPIPPGWANEFPRPLAVPQPQDPYADVAGSSARMGVADSHPGADASDPFAEPPLS